MHERTSVGFWAVGLGILVVSLWTLATPVRAQTIGVMGVSNTKLAWTNGYQVVSGQVGWPVGGRGGCTIRRIGTEIGLNESCTTQFWNRSVQYGRPDIILWQLGNSEAPSPIPELDVRLAFMVALDWFDENFPESRLILMSLPDYDASAPCRGGQDEWFDYEVSNRLIDWAVRRGRAERADIVWPMYYREDMRAADARCQEKYGKCDVCHQNEWRVEEDGWTLDAFVNSLIVDLDR